MPSVTLEEARARLPELLAALVPGEELLLTRDGQPIAILKALPPAGSQPRFGSANGKILYMADDFDAPMEDFKEYME